MSWFPLMKICINEWCVGFLCIFFLGVTYAETSVWKITKNNQHLYLGGTIHVLSATDYPLPDPFEKVYQLSQRVVLETDMQKLQKGDYQQLMLHKLIYQDGKTLASVLSTQTYQRLQNYCKSRNILLSSIEAFKPGLVTMILLLTELQRLGLSGAGVDAFFNSKAQQDNMPVSQLETLEEQLDFLVDMGRGKENELIENSLNDLADLPAMMKNLKRAWRTGNMAALERVAMESYIGKYPHTLDSLLEDRNSKWMSKLETMLQSAEVEFVLVGVLHLTGEQGLLNQLKSRGYAVEQYKCL